MNKKSFASTIIAVILVCPVLAVTHTFTPTDIDSLKVKMSDGSLQPGDTLLLQDGTYSHLGKVSFTGNGTTDYPIILKAANTGKAIYLEQQKYVCQAVIYNWRDSTFIKLGHLILR